MTVLLAIAAATVWGLVCIGCYRIHCEMITAQEDAINQAEMDYLYRRMHEHKGE